MLNPQAQTKLERTKETKISTACHPSNGDSLLLKVARESAMRVRRERRFEERRQNSEEVSATAAPLPIETPTSACVKATISLICDPASQPIPSRDGRTNVPRRRQT